MKDLLTVRYGGREKVHLARDHEQTLCGVPYNYEWVKKLGEDTGLRDTDDDPDCRKCLRHYAREVGRMVEHELRDMWDVSVGNGGW